MKEKQRVVIIGSGFGGLSAAALLAKDGYDVTIIEKNNFIGGRAHVSNQDGFVFDMGPSWYLMPEVFERYFSHFGKKSVDFYQLKRLDPSYRLFFGKSDKIDISADLNKNLQTFESLEAGAANKLQKFLDQSKFEYDIAMSDFVYRDYKSIFDFFNLKTLLYGPKLHIFESMDTFVNRYFKNEKLKKILQYTIVFLGGTPKLTPALYSIMSHVDFNLGVWYPMGGLGKVVEALHKLCLENRVKFIMNQEVKKIVIEKNKAIGVETANGFIPADIVVANADYAHVETSLLDKKNSSFGDDYWSKKKIAPSGFIVYLGLNKKLSSLTHHNLFIANDWIKHFDSIFDSPSWAENPSYYVSCPSKTDPTVAPKNHENLFILVPVAAGLEDSEKIRQKYFDKILTDIETICGEKIRDSVVYKRIFTHSDFKSLYNAYKGTALGLSHTLWQTAIFRPPNQNKKIKNLYYSGQYTNPGIGVPMTIICGEITHKLIVDNHAL